MQKLFIAIIFLLVSNVMYSQAFFEDIYPLEGEVFKRFKVSKIEVLDYNFDNAKGDWKADGFLSRRAVYNQKGKPIQYEFYFEDPAWSQYNFSMDFEYFSDEKERWIGHESDPANDKITWAYFENGKKIKTYTYTLDSTLLNRNDFSYDAIGNLLRVAEYSATGEMQKDATYEYNEHGQKVGETYYHGPEHRLLTTVTYTWPSAKKRFRQEKTEQGYDFGSVEYEYDDRGRLVKEWTKGPLSKKRTYREFVYASGSDLIYQIISYSTSGAKVKLTKYRYKFQQ